MILAFNDINKIAAIKMLKWITNTIKLFYFNGLRHTTSVDRASDPSDTPMIDTTDEFVLVLCDHIHTRACQYPKMSAAERYTTYGLGTPFPHLKPECREWCEVNTPGFRETNHEAANFLMRVYFVNEKHAALFKLFWM